MKQTKIVTIAALLLFVLTGTNSSAQKVMMMGQIQNEKNKAVWDADIQLTGKSIIETCASDKRGLFTSPELEPGKYKVKIKLNGKYYNAGKYSLSAERPYKYYYFTLTKNGKVKTKVSDENPYMETTLNDVSENGHRVLSPKPMMIIDKSGGVQQKPGAVTPAMK